MNAQEKEYLTTCIIDAIKIIDPNKLIRILANKSGNLIILRAMTVHNNDADAIEELRLIGSEIIANYQTEMLDETLLLNDIGDDLDIFANWIDISISRQ